MPEKNPRPGQIYKHFKDRLYQIIAVAEHTETGEKLVVYQALYPDFQIYARPLSLFMSEVDKKKYPQSQQKFRFEEVQVRQEFKIQPPQERPVQAEKSREDTEIRQEEPSQDGVNPILIQFLDAATIHEKMQVVCDNKRLIDKKCISDLAVSLDITICESDLEKQYEELVSCLNTMKRFEVGRLR